MTVTDQQVRLLMETYTRIGLIETAAAKAGMCRQTGAKYLANGRMPSEEASEQRYWRTREDMLAAVWGEAEEMLRDAPELEAKTLFEWLCVHYPDELQEKYLRTFQRRVRQWRASSGPDQEVFFPQDVPPGRRMSVDFTHMTELGITINGIAFVHMVCHCVLSYSSWEWATVCFSESMQALRQGIQDALFRLGRVPKQIWTDNSTSATHNPAVDDNGQKRPFNASYVDLVNHFGMQPHTIAVGKSNENGAVESSNGHLKRRLNQHLLLRGSRDFNNRDQYTQFINKVLEAGNQLRRDRLAADLDAMPILKASRLAEYTEERTKVRKWSVVPVAHNIYSVPSRLIGEQITARVHEDRVCIYYKGELQLEAPRLRGRGKVSVNYQHIIHSLVRKPGAFQDYRYKAELFPTLNFRKAYDRLQENCVPRTADLEYLRILKLAADTMETIVDDVLAQLLAANRIPRWTTVEEFMPEARVDAVPNVEIEPVDLSAYDSLLQEICS